MKQMKGRKPFLILLSLVLIASMVMSSVAYVTGSDNPRKPDKQNPVTATDVELVKKTAVKPLGPSIAPPGQEKKKVKAIATGVLGEPVLGDRYAVVVGISDYPGEGSDLSYCDDDANEMYDVLTEVYGFTEVNLLLDLDATRDNILTAIAEIPPDAGEVVFFFSGHGMRGRADDNDEERWDEAIVTHDGTSIVPIWDGELKDAFSQFDTSRIVFVFDTCLAGGMKEDLEAPGRFIAMATTERGLAYEDSSWGGGHGEFSYYFVEEGMHDGNADVYDHNGNEINDDVTMDEAFDYAKINCAYDKPTVGDYFENDLLL